MDISAVGGVIAEHLLESDTPGDLATRLFTGLLSEGLMVLATRQHVKAWRGELGSVFRDTAWTLYHELWQWAAARKPELDPAERSRLVEQLLQPLRADGDSSPETARAILACSLYVLLVVEALADSVVAPD